MSVHPIMIGGGHWNKKRVDIWLAQMGMVVRKHLVVLDKIQTCVIIHVTKTLTSFPHPEIAPDESKQGGVYHPCWKKLPKLVYF